MSQAVWIAIKNKETKERNYSISNSSLATILILLFATNNLIAHS